MAGNRSTARRRRWAAVAALLAVNLVVAGLLAELAGNALFYANRRGFFYAADRAAMSASTVAETYQTKQVIFHPYLGYVNHPDRDDDPVYGVNNHGFQVHRSLLQQDRRCCDYPMKRGPDEALVGIFGGSVGVGFAGAAQSDPQLAALLAAMPRFAGKKIRFLNFALSGYRQPQGLQTLSYYLSLGQAFDLVINIDGFNETVNSVLNWQEGVDPTFPPDAIWGAMGRDVEQGKPRAGGADLLAGWHRFAAAEAAAAEKRCRVAACYLWQYVTQRWHAWRARALSSKARGRTEGSSWFPARHPEALGKETDLPDYIADRWRDSSLLMAGMLASRGIPYVHVLQPNQWYRPSFDYTPLRADHPYQWVVEPVNRFYAAFERRGEDLRNGGVAFMDATPIFKGLDSRRIFADDCCHYTPEGYRILFADLARFIADRPTLARATAP